MLFSNLEKSVATPIHCSEQDMLLVHEILAYQTKNFPCRYLGILLPIHMLR